MKPRTIFYTLFNIMLDVLKKDPKASFFFIGAKIHLFSQTYKCFAKNDVHIACI